MSEIMLKIILIPVLFVLILHSQYSYAFAKDRSFPIVLMIQRDKTKPAWQDFIETGLFLDVRTTDYLKPYREFHKTDWPKGSPEEALNDVMEIFAEESNQDFNLKVNLYAISLYPPESRKGQERQLIQEYFFRYRKLVTPQIINSSKVLAKVDFSDTFSVAYVEAEVRKQRLIFALFLVKRNDKWVWSREEDENTKSTLMNAVWLIKESFLHWRDYPAKAENYAKAQTNFSFPLVKDEEVDIDSMEVNERVIIKIRGKVQLCEYSLSDGESSYEELKFLQKAYRKVSEGDVEGFSSFHMAGEREKIRRFSKLEPKQLAMALADNINPDRSIYAILGNNSTRIVLSHIPTGQWYKYYCEILLKDGDSLKFFNFRKMNTVKKLFMTDKKFPDLVLNPLQKMSTGSVKKNNE